MGKKRMGRPPAGPDGMKVEDLPRVTIRLEPGILERARIHARETGQPLWRLVQELLRAHLDQEALLANPEAASESAASDMRQLSLTRREVEALIPTLHWSTSTSPSGEDGQEREAVRGLLERACEYRERLFRFGLDMARRRPRTPASPPSWELPLEHCRRLRRVARQFLDATKERVESEIRSFSHRRQDSMSVLDQEQQRQRIRREMRGANGELRSVLKKIPWQ